MTFFHCLGKIEVRIGYFILFITLLFSNSLQAQKHSPSRYEIDMKREIYGRNYASQEALLRSREFTRLDPTYYIGYMFEGFFRFERAADARGFQEALIPLKKALTLYEKDYADILKNVYSSAETFNEGRTRIMDYTLITDRIMDCYSNLEKPDSVIDLLKHYKSWNFQYDYLGADNYIAWTYHRNRFYTSEKYSFLRNSVEENTRTALNYLQNNLDTIQQNSAKNEAIMSYNMVLGSKMSVYHYLAIVYSYLRKPDSARMYYEFMEPYNIFPYNNFAIFCYINGDFNDSYKYFRHSQYIESSDRRLKEPFYYLSILDAMSSRPQHSVKRLDELIESTGVRPGWGWYNIALGRSLLYNGELDKSIVALDKASKFKEIHMGTTLGESHYTFSFHLLRLLNLENKLAELNFQDRYYWLSPSKLKEMSELKLKIFSLRFLLFNQLSSNPEREELYYRLFSSEGTVSFDETYFMIKDYGRQFFIKNFEKQAQTDERVPIRKYFTLLQAKLLLEKGNNKEALKLLLQLDKNVVYDKEFEALYAARLYEAMAKIYDNLGNKKDYFKYLNLFYVTYPQLVPYSKLRMQFRLEVENQSDNKEHIAILKELKDYNINFVDNNNDKSPRVILAFSTKGNKKIVTYKVETYRGIDIVDEKELVYDKYEGVGRKIAYGIFNVGSTFDFDY